MIYIGADHNGFFLKEKLKAHLAKRRLAFKDCGAFRFVKSDDYVDFAAKVAKSVRPGDWGVLICGSGHGMAIAANKIPGARAILPLNTASVRAGRRDDHANILVLAARRMTLEQAKKFLSVFLSTRAAFAARYLRRLRKIKALER